VAFLHVQNLIHGTHWPQPEHPLYGGLKLALIGTPVFHVLLKISLWKAKLDAIDVCHCDPSRGGDPQSAYLAA
jgi:hypothetical protein